MTLVAREKTKIVCDLNKQIILVYGAPKIGKSTFCSKFEKPLFLATEPGLNHLEVFKTNITSWKDFLNVCGELATDTQGYKTIVVDTIDKLVMYCTEFICKREGINHPSDYDYGKGWSMITQELQRVLTKFCSLPYGFVFVSHAKTEEKKTKTKSYNRETVSLTGENRRVVLNLVDIILFVTQKVVDEKEVRIAHTKPSLYYEAGDRSNKLPAEVKFDFTEISKYFK